MTNHDLNVQAAEAVGWKWKGVALKGVSGQVVLSSEVLDRCYFEKTKFDPATSIADAMGLLKLLPERWSVEMETVNPTVRVCLCCDENWSSAMLNEYWDYDQLPRAITEAFVAAKKEAKEASDG